MKNMKKFEFKQLLKFRKKIDLKNWNVFKNLKKLRKKLKWILMK